MCAGESYGCSILVHLLVDTHRSSCSPPRSSAGESRPPTFALAAPVQRSALATTGRTPALTTTTLSPSQEPAATVKAQRASFARCAGGYLSGEDTTSRLDVASTSPNRERSSASTRYGALYDTIGPSKSMKDEGARLG